MIRLATEVESLDSRKVPLGTKFKRIFLERASDREIDFAIVNEKQLKDFEASETGMMSRSTGSNAFVLTKTNTNYR